MALQRVQSFPCFCIPYPERSVCAARNQKLFPTDYNQQQCFYKVGVAAQAEGGFASGAGPGPDRFVPASGVDCAGMRGDGEGCEGRCGAGVCVRD